MAAPSAWTIYDQLKYKLGTKTLSLSSDSMKMALFTSSSNAGTTALATATYATLTNEVSNANGYATGGASISPTWSNASGTETFTASSATWSATSSGITARFAVIYDSSTGDLICWCYLDSTPADVSVAAGNQLTVSANAAGVFTLA